MIIVSFASCLATEKKVASDTQGAGDRLQPSLMREEYCCWKRIEKRGWTRQLRPHGHAWTCFSTCKLTPAKSAGPHSLMECSSIWTSSRKRRTQRLRYG